MSRPQLTFMFITGFTSTRLGLRSVLPQDTPTKNPELPVRLETRTPGLQVKQFCDCETLMPPRRPFFQITDFDI